MLVNQPIYQKYFLLQTGLDSSQSHALYFKPFSSRVINKQYSFIRLGFCDIQNNHPITISRRDETRRIIPDNLITNTKSNDLFYNVNALKKIATSCILCATYRSQLSASK